ncbi:Hypothetical predicted protein [Marmota monax]|uniref:Uncharacterized protein n=1 Tax=Marmota monax TaxID=9995 RepID=A0A5E4AFW3_MARMO|nr:hypothetical protein GHT09_017914 [Marmota monax]VTJ55621.1 Hypothetical predicted protein [Marmota monax]
MAEEPGAQRRCATAMAVLRRAGATEADAWVSSKAAAPPSGPRGWWPGTLRADAGASGRPSTDGPEQRRPVAASTRVTFCGGDFGYPSDHSQRCRMKNSRSR